MTTSACVSLLALLLLGACGGKSPTGSRRDQLVVAAPGDGYGLGGDAELGLYPINTNIYEPLVYANPAGSAKQSSITTTGVCSRPTRLTSIDGRVTCTPLAALPECPANRREASR